jgi:hypothetical protein
MHHIFAFGTLDPGSMTLSYKYAPQIYCKLGGKVKGLIGN